MAACYQSFSVSNFDGGGEAGLPTFQPDHGRLLYYNPDMKTEWNGDEEQATKRKKQMAAMEREIKNMLEPEFERWCAAPPPSMRCWWWNA